MVAADVAVDEVVVVAQATDELPNVTRFERDQTVLPAGRRGRIVSAALPMTAFGATELSDLTVVVPGWTTRGPSDGLGVVRYVDGVRLDR